MGEYSPCTVHTKHTKRKMTLVTIEPRLGDAKFPWLVDTP